tara:strand:+ start:1148 stop:1894 length:747 start_codon:yes stop_codon:yes gene_type:complete
MIDLIKLIQNKFNPFASTYKLPNNTQGYQVTDTPLVSSRGQSTIPSIERVFASVVNTGHLSPARYEVTVNCPALDTIIRLRRNLTLRGENVNERLSVSCESVSMPGRSVSSQPNKIYGPVREMPYEKLYSGDLDMEFRVGKDMFERLYFEQWMDLVTFQGNHHMNYMDNYAGTVTIAQLDHDDDIVYQIELFEVYPKTINPISYGYGNVDDYVKQSVSLHFRHYNVINYTQTLPDVPRDASGVLPLDL